MKHVTLKLKEDGTAELLCGPEVPLAQQHRAVQGYRDTNVPEGVFRIVTYRLDQPTKFAYRKPVAPLPPAPSDLEESGEPQGEGSSPQTSPAAEPPKPAAGIAAQLLRAQPAKPGKPGAGQPAAA